MFSNFGRALIDGGGGTRARSGGSSAIAARRVNIRFINRRPVPYLSSGISSCHIGNAFSLLLVKIFGVNPTRKVKVNGKRLARMAIGGRYLIWAILSLAAALISRSP